MSTAIFMPALESLFLQETHRCQLAPAVGKLFTRTAIRSLRFFSQPVGPAFGSCLSSPPRFGDRLYEGGPECTAVVPRRSDLKTDEEESQP